MKKRADSSLVFRGKKRTLAAYDEHDRRVEEMKRCPACGSHQ
jgi:predicted Zn-ribbon and HTH transcriptional regulator